MRNSIRYLLVGFAVVTGSLFALSGMASAQSGSSDGYVLSKTVSRTAELPAAAPATAVKSTSAQESALAFTGGDAALLASIGGVAVVAGSAILVARRRIVQA